MALILTPQGHVEHAFYGVDDAERETFTAHVEPGTAAALIDFLLKMRFMMRVEITDVTEDLAVTWRPAARQNVAFDGYEFIPRDKLTDYAAAAGPAEGVRSEEPTSELQSLM